MRILLGLFSLIFSSCLLSMETYEYIDQKGKNLILQYENEGKWYVDKLLIRPQALQKKIFSKTFNDSTSAQIYFNRFKFEARPFAIFSNFKNAVTEKNGSIWEVKNSWSLAWEKKFEKWIIDNFSRDFFYKYQIPTDCADVAYALRWIFSRENNLPAAATLYGSSVLMTQDTLLASWSKLPSGGKWYEDKRFMASLMYLLGNTFTGTLKEDTFPIALTPDSFIVGTIHLENSHTMLFDNFNNPENIYPLTLLYSTLPIEVRKLSSMAFYRENPINISGGGLLSMRWPVYENGQWTLVSKDKMPRYSLEQYSSKNISQDLIQKLDLHYDIEVAVKGFLGDLKTMLFDRVAIVEAGYEFCLKNDCTFNNENYEIHSTPSRDRRILETYINYYNHIRESASSQAMNIWLQGLEEDIEIRGVTRKLNDWIDLFYFRQISSDPQDSKALRWGDTLEDRFLAITNSLERKIEYREILLKNNQCIDNEACYVGGELWKQNNTIKYDTEIFDLLLGLAKVCVNKNSLCDGATIPKKYQKYLFLISDPKARESERRGEHIDLNKIIVSPTSKAYKRLGEDVFVSFNYVTSRLYDYVFYNSAGEKILNAPLSAIPMNLKNLNIYFLMDDNLNVYLVDTLTGETKKLSLPSLSAPNKEDRLLSKNTLVKYTYGNKVSIVTLNGPKPKITEEFENASILNDLEIQENLPNKTNYVLIKIGDTYKTYIWKDEKKLILDEYMQLISYEYPDIVFINREKKLVKRNILSGTEKTILEDIKNYNLFSGKYLSLSSGSKWSVFKLGKNKTELSLIFTENGFSECEYFNSLAFNRDLLICRSDEYQKKHFLSISNEVATKVSFDKLIGNSLDYIFYYHQGEKFKFDLSTKEISHFDKDTTFCGPQIVFETNKICSIQYVNYQSINYTDERTILTFNKVDKFRSKSEPLFNRLSHTLDNANYNKTWTDFQFENYSDLESILLGGNIRVYFKNP